VTRHSLGVESAAAAIEDDPALTALVRRALWMSAVLLLALVLGVGALGVFYRAELLGVTQWIFLNLGIPGLALIVFAADGLNSPIPPDLALVVVANSELVGRAWSLVLFLGVVSVIAGNLGWLLGAKLGETRLGRLVMGRFGSRAAALVRRFGMWGVAIGALTPIPFSLTCWAAGMLQMEWQRFTLVTLLRFPRYALYYWAIAYSETLLRSLA